MQKQKQTLRAIRQADNKPRLTARQTDGHLHCVCVCVSMFVAVCVIVCVCLCVKLN